VSALLFAGDLYKIAGSIGAIVAQKNIEHGINDIATGIKSLGNFTQQALSVQPIVTAPDLKTSEFIKALIYAATEFRTIKNLASETENAIKIAWGLRKQVKPVETAINKLTEEVAQFKTQVLDTFKQTIAQAPLKNIPRAPVILLKALGDAIRKLKIAFSDVLESSSVFVNVALNMGPGIFNLAKEFNDVFAKITNSAILNPDFVRIVGEAMSQAIPNINEGLKKLMQSLKEDMPEEEPETTIAAAPAA
jgi:hypothetical protein